MFNKFYQLFCSCLILCGYFFTCESRAQATADPTRPLHDTQSYSGAGGITVPGKTGIQLTSIFFGSGKKSVIINGQILSENQTLKGIGATVKKIEADAVTLQQGNKIWRIVLNRTVVRQ